MLARHFDGRPDNYKRGQSKGTLTLGKSKKQVLSDAGFSTHQQRTISRAEELLKQFDGRGNHWSEKNKSMGNHTSNLTQKEVTEQSRHKKPASKPMAWAGW